MLTALALTAAAAYCPVTVTKDYVFPAVYKAMLTAPACDGITRVRKVSTINPKTAAQKPGGAGGIWAWNLAGVPDKELWTLYTWQWQWWDGAKWQRAVVK